MKKIICLILALLTLSTALAGCGEKKMSEEEIAASILSSLNGTEAGDENEETTEPPVQEDASKEEIAAAAFINALINGDFDAALRCLNVPEETPFLTASDIEWFLPRSEYADVENFNADSVTMETTTDGGSESASCTVTVSQEGKNSVEFTLRMVLNQDNEWKVDESSFYVKDFYIMAPGGEAKLFIDGVEVDKGMIVGIDGSTRVREIYCIDYIGKQEKTLSVKADTFGETEKKVNPMSNAQDDCVKINPFYEDEEAFAAIADIWNGVYAVVESGGDASDVMPFISKEADSEMAGQIFNWVKTATGGDDDHKDFVVFDVSACSDPEWRCFWASDDVLVMQFNYSMSWTFLGSTQGMRNYQQMLLQKTEDGFVVYRVLNEGVFFSWINQFTDERK